MHCITKTLCMSILVIILKILKQSALKVLFLLTSVESELGSNFALIFFPLPPEIITQDSCFQSDSRMSRNKFQENLSWNTALEEKPLTTV